MYTINENPTNSGAYTETFEVCGSVISFETFPRTHGRLIDAGLAIEICFYHGSLDLSIAAHDAVFMVFFS
jgi:hypothetical protein